MTKKIEPRTLKGFPDYGPKEQLARQNMFRKIQGVFERFGFQPMSTPALEYKEVLMNKYGDEEKLVYSFTDNGGREVALRYDLTVPMARFVAERKGSLLLPFKRYQIAPVWRAENTQKGRLREFYQCDVDVVGTTPQLADAEVITCYATVLQELGVRNFVIKINDRQIFRLLAQTPQEEEQLVQVIRCVDKADKIGVEGVVQLMEERGIASALKERTADFLSWGKGNAFLERVAQMNGEGAARARDWQQLLQIIQTLGVGEDVLVFDPSIARGLDYYTSTVFEFTLADVQGYGSIVGGGRYDGLLDTFSDAGVPAVGGSLGIDRLYQYLENEGKLSLEGAVEVLVLNMGDQSVTAGMRIATSLRQAGVNAEIYYEPVKQDKQFKYAESKGVRLAILVGEEEQAQGIVKVKNMETREQVEVSEKDLLIAVRG